MYDNLGSKIRELNSNYSDDNYLFNMDYVMDKYVEFIKEDENLDSDNLYDFQDKEDFDYVFRTVLLIKGYEEHYTNEEIGRMIYLMFKISEEN